MVTRLVADLEDHLGTRLLHRTTRRVSLTDAGESYLERVRLILQDLDEAHALVSSQTSDLAGVLRLLASRPPPSAAASLHPRPARPVCLCRLRPDRRAKARFLLKTGH